MATSHVVRALSAILQSSDQLADAERAALLAACAEVCDRLTPGTGSSRDHSGQPLHKRHRALTAPFNKPAPPVSDGDDGAGELVLLGSGLKAMAHLTREAMVHLRAADVVFGALNPTGPDRRWLELALSRPIIDLNQFYPASASEDRRTAYVRGAEAVLREVRRGRRVAVVEYGHPTCCVAQSEALLRGARRAGARVSVLPGVSCVDALWADLGVDPAAGCLVCTAEALLSGSAAPRGAIGRGLPHLVLLMPEAVGDHGTGADLAAGRASLADAPAWLALLALLEGAYGAGARCLLHRAPVWASVAEACLLSVPLASLRCRSCVDGLLRAWGGDLGTMYLWGGGAAVDAGGGAAAAAGTADAAGAAGAVAAPPPPEPAAGAPGYGPEQRALLRRWGVFEVREAAWRAAPEHTHHGTVRPCDCVPPESGFALGAPPRSERGFDADTLARLRADATPVEADGGALALATDGGGGDGGSSGAAEDAMATWRRDGYLAARDAAEASDAAVRLQLAFAACSRTDAPAAVGALAAQLGRGWEELAAATLRASGLYGQLGLPQSGADALWGQLPAVAGLPAPRPTAAFEAAPASLPLEDWADWAG